MASVNVKRNGINNTRTTSFSRIWTYLILFPLAVLLTIWIFTAFHFFMQMGVGIDGDESKMMEHLAPPSSSHAIQGHLRNNRGMRSSRMGTSHNEDGQDGIRNNVHQQPKPANASPKSRQQNNSIESPHHATASSKLLSRDARVAISSSARGNLGPSSVLNQNPPGADWLKDRWQAASDMGGTAIPGRHWVLVDFTHLLEDGGYGGDAALYVDKVVLDWETAFAKDYLVQGRIAALPSPTKIDKHGRLDENNDGRWCTLYDGALDVDIDNEHDGGNHNQPHRSVRESGQSPGVKQKLPLHIVHTIDWTAESDEHIDNAGVNSSESCDKLRYLRIYIRKPARGWGVSLWEVDVFGTIV